MRDGGYTLWTYKSDDGKTTEQVWNAGHVMVPDFITAKDGVTQLALDRTSAVTQAKSYSPPAGTRSVVAWTPPAPSISHGSQLQVGWPGMTTVA